MTVITFDTHSAVKRLIKNGVREKQAEEFVKIITEIKDTEFDKVASKEQVAVLEKDLETFMQHVATKADLEKVRTELHQSDKRLILTIGGAVVTICSVIFGAVQYLLLHLA